MVTLRSKHITALLVLAAVLLMTRLFHFKFPPDASWAVFFLSGLHRLRFRAFALLLLEAVMIDYAATAHVGVSSYCLSVAYLFLPPAYAALWLGGRWAANHGSAVAWRGIAALALGAVTSISVSFLLTNGSFYWLSGRQTHPDMAGWAAGFARWYPHFLAVSCLYVGLAVSIQLLGARLAPGRSGTGRHLPQH